MSKAPPLFDLDRVGFRLGERQILSEVTLRIEEGRVVCLVGPNGSGKSTLLKLLACQLLPTQGTIALRGAPVSAMQGKAFARSVAYMPQFTPPAEGMTVGELVALGRFPWHGALGRTSDADRSKVAAAIARTGLKALENRLVDGLSGGERQRAWIAMMLAQDTQCLLLDEPTSALDIGHQAGMLELLRSLSRERQVAVIVVLHDINMAARIGDEIVGLGAGRIVARGSSDDVMEAAVLERIYGMPLGVMPHPSGGRLSFLP